MNQNAGATATPSSRSVETDNVYVRAQYPDGSNRPITTASTSNNGVLGNTNRRYYFNSSVNQNALSRSSALNRAKRSVHHHPDARITTLPLDDSTPTLTLTSSSNFGHSGKSKRVSPLPRLFRLVSKSSDYLERKLQSLNRTGSTSELLGAANLRPDQNKPIRSVRKKSLETTEQLTIITTTGTGSELVWTHVDGISFENNRLISNRLCHDQDVTASIEPSSNESTSEASPMHQPLDSYLIQDRSNSILSNHNQHTVHIRSSTGADHWQRWWRLIRNVMRQQGRQIAIAALLLLSIWNAFGNNDEPLKTRSAAQPRKFFFDPDSRVIDFELGNLAHLSQAASKREATLVMYYAPWDAECQRFRRDYETIASHYREQVMLAAINCWWPEGECGKSFKIKRYPILLAYLRSVGEVEYRGPLVTSYLMTFIDNLLNPLERLIGAGDLLHLRAKHDAVVLGFFDFDHSPNPPGYEHFLQASIKALHTDPWRRVQFAIVSSKSSSAKFEFERTGQVQIHTWNDTVIYGGNLHQVDTFVRWIFEIVFELQRPLIEWVTASGKKSDALISRLSSGPTLLLFTPRSLVFGISPYFEVASDRI